jgi:hypothetical protein
VSHWHVARHALMSWPLVCWACAHGVDDETPLDVPLEAGGQEPSVETGSAIDSGGDEEVGADAASFDDAASIGDAASIDDGPTLADASSDTAPTGADATADASPCGCGARSVCVGGACTPARRVFVTDETYGGALGGHAGADATCQSLATGAGLGGTWMAWISDSTSSPSQRFSKPTVGYFLLDGTPVASSWTALTTNGPTHAVDLTETRVSLAAVSADASKTWTATVVSGALGTPSCSDFATNASTKSGSVGHCTGTGTVNWTAAYAGEACSVPNRLYCFEQ